MVATREDGLSPVLGLFAALAALGSVSAGCGGSDFVHTSYEAEEIDRTKDWLVATATAETQAGPGMGQRSDQTFRNTYYDFPAEGDGKKDAKVFDASCQPIASVTKVFHDQVCLQGSGKLSTGETISFAKRDCECAAVCPKSDQKICFEKLDPKKFPSGRGALGQPVTPLRTLAVDDKVIPLGSVVYIPEYAGLPRPDGGQHDGCFIAEDRGSKVTGYHVDLFTGNPATTRSWNDLVPSNTGVHVEIDAPRCAYLKPR
ncbi:MAG: 3D domain-containing protein [Polyangiaceae bacterium]